MNEIVDLAKKAGFFVDEDDGKILSPFIEDVPINNLLANFAALVRFKNKDQQQPQPQQPSFSTQIDAAINSFY